MKILFVAIIIFLDFSNITYSQEISNNYADLKFNNKKLFDSLMVNYKQKGFNEFLLVFLLYSEVENIKGEQTYCFAYKNDTNAFVSVYVDSTLYKTFQIQNKDYFDYKYKLQTIPLESEINNILLLEYFGTAEFSLIYISDTLKFCFETYYDKKYGYYEDKPIRLEARQNWAKLIVSELCKLLNNKLIIYKF